MGPGCPGDGWLLLRGWAAVGSGMGVPCDAPHMGDAWGGMRHTGGNMPFYQGIPESDVGRRTAQGLLRLREALLKVPERQLSGNLLLATWNLREFDSASYGLRPDEAIRYIVEVISAFDLVALQEVRDTRALDRLVDYLGGWWKYLVTDVTEGRPGNKERLAFLYDSRKVKFGGLAGELVIPPLKTAPANQPARTPFIAGFQAGWFRFALCTVHSLYGKGGARSVPRAKEIAQVAELAAKRAKSKDPGDKWQHNFVLLGDFNIFKPDPKDPSFVALTKTGFEMPAAIRTGLPGSNANQDKHFDQIAFLSRVGGFSFSGQAGVVDVFSAVYRAGDFPAYREEVLAYVKAQAKKSGKPAKTNVDALKATYNRWRTYQVSDHFPLWVELNTDFSDHYLHKKAAWAPNVNATIGRKDVR